MKNSLLLTSLLLAPSLNAQVFNITSSDTTSATGNIEVNGFIAATFTLTQNSNTSMSNLTFVGGANGIQVSSAGPDDADDASIVDATSYTFTVNSTTGYAVTSTTLSQSGYENSIGNNDTAEWSLAWSGLAGTVSDANNQIIADPDSHNVPDYADGDSITSGSNFLTGYVHNDSDTWSVNMPTNSFTMDYISRNTPNHAGVPTEQADLKFESYREWMTFDAVVTEVPEPSSTVLVGLGAFGLMLRRRR